MAHRHNPALQSLSRRRQIVRCPQGLRRDGLDGRQRIFDAVTQLVEKQTLQFGALVMDIERHTVTDGGREVKLTAKEFLLLQYLLEHRGRVLSRDLLLSDVWGYRYTGGTRTVDVHVRRLREKIPALGDALITVKQFGYKLEEPPSP